MRLFALEEHYATPEVVAAWKALDPRWADLALKHSTQGDTGRRLLDFGAERFAAMAEAGVDVQVLSLTAPGLQSLQASQAVALQCACNDLVAETVRAHPDRLQGFATLATPDPLAAARELERAVTTLGLDGAMIFGRTRDRNLDHPEFWPIFEVASAHKAPLYLHPQSPDVPVRDAYYSGISPEIDAAFATHGLGWHYETGIQLLRLVLSGVFDRFPDLQVVVGHWGEVVLFYLDRIDQMTATAKLSRKPSEVIRDHVFVTPSGIFSQRYLRWAIEVMGIERILFATDYPFVQPKDGGARQFLESAPLGAAERELVAAGNWERMRAAIRR